MAKSGPKFIMISGLNIAKLFEFTQVINLLKTSLNPIRKMLKKD